MLSTCGWIFVGAGRLFLLVHLDAAGDHVELCKISLEEAPSNAVEELDSFTPPSWSILVSDCSSSESEAPGAADAKPKLRKSRNEEEI